MKKFHRALPVSLLVLSVFTSCINHDSKFASSKIELDHYDAVNRLQIKEATVKNTPNLALIAQVDDDTSKKKNTKIKKAQLTFQELIKSTEDKFPLILAAMETVEIADGERLAAEGGFDLYLKSEVNVNGEGYYQNETAKVKLEQAFPDFGAKVFGGYKIGQGDFPSWDGDLQSDRGGEFSVGISLPLLANRSIDKRRVDLWKSRISQDKAQPMILEKRLEVTRKAAELYWKWVASGQKLNIARQLLELAEKRHKALELSLKEGEVPKISLVENRQIVVERESIVTQSERLLQQSGIALSLYWRDSDGNPVVPDPQRVPDMLPIPKDPEKVLHVGDLQLALEKRPELQIYDLKRKELSLEAQLAENTLLPNLYLSGEISQDVGSTATDPDTKGPFEAGIFLRLDVPIQRRKAKGKLKTIEAKISQLVQEKKMTQDKIVARVKDTTSALKQIWLRLSQVSENVALANEIEKVERLKLSEGQSDLLRVNLREQKTATAAAKRVDIIAEYFRIIADYRASLGLAYNELK
ncbi:MAG: TolC family protein [Lentisphaeraceae bacterium]|nr:TolC family protein [Lentisphaeraceae bacterium]